MIFYSCHCDLCRSFPEFVELSMPNNFSGAFGLVQRIIEPRDWSDNDMHNTCATLDFTVAV